MILNILLLLLILKEYKVFKYKYIYKMSIDINDEFSAGILKNACNHISFNKTDRLKCVYDSNGFIHQYSIMDTNYNIVSVLKWTKLHYKIKKEFKLISDKNKWIY